MRKSFAIIVLFLVINTLGAQVPGYYNGGRRSSGSWFGSNQTTFHKGNDAFGRYNTSGPSYGFVGSSSSQYYRSEARGYSRVAPVGSADAYAVSSSYGVRVNAAPVRRAVAENVPVQSKGTLLRCEVWNDARRSSGGGAYIGGSDATNYGRRVKPQGVPGNNATSYTNGSSNTALKTSSANASSMNSLPGDLDATGNNGGYGFGEVPHDDSDAAPLGDGVLLLLLMAGAVAIKKNW